MILKNRVINKSIAIILMLTFLLSGFSAFAKDGESEKEKTVISGISASVSALSKNFLTKTITVKPANGKRTVRLQIYNSREKMYKTVKKYVTEDSDSAKLTIVFPKKYRRKVLGKWRISVEKTKSARSAEKYITLTTRNIVQKELKSKAACIYCVDDNNVIYVKNFKKHRKMASTTKVMTATLLLESDKLPEETVVSAKASNTPYSTPWMLEGDSYKNKALLHALLLPSSNGAAVAIAESVEGTTKKFIRAMNKRAKELGMNDTHYVNPHGLDAKNHYSCAYDVAKVTGYIYNKSETFREIVAKKKYKITSKKGRTSVIETTDLLKDYSTKHKGGKTGYTSGAGCCFCGIYEHKGKTYAVCVLGAKKSEMRWSDMKKLYKYVDKYATTKY